MPDQVVRVQQHWRAVQMSTYCAALQINQAHIGADTEVLNGPQANEISREQLCNA